MFMDAEDVKHGYPTRRGYSASNLLTFAEQDKNRLQTNGHLNQLDQRRRSSEDVNQSRSDSSSNVLKLGDKNQALSVPDVSLRRLSSPEIDMILPGITSTTSSSMPSTIQNSQSSSHIFSGNQEMVITDKPPPKASSEEPTKTILKSPTEHFKVFVTDDVTRTERLAGEFQTVKFTTNLAESTRISRPQRPQVCHLLTMSQSVIMRLPKFTLSESTIVEHATASGDEEEKSSPSQAKMETTSINTTPAPNAPHPIAPSKSTSKLHGILKNLKGSGSDKNKQDDQSTRKGSGSEKIKQDNHTSAKASEQGKTKSTSSEHKVPEAPTLRRRFRPKSGEGSSNSPTRTRKDFLRRRRIRDKGAVKDKAPIVQHPETKVSARMPCREVSNPAQNEEAIKGDTKPEQWKRWEIISSEHMETLV